MVSGLDCLQEHWVGILTLLAGAQVQNERPGLCFALRPAPMCRSDCRPGKSRSSSLCAVRSISTASWKPSRFLRDILTEP